MNGASTTLAKNEVDIKGFYRVASGANLIENLEKAGNSPTNDLFHSGTRQRTEALSNLATVGRVLITVDGNLKPGNVVEVQRSERSGHEYKLRVLENSGAASRDKVSWVHVRPDTTVNGHSLNFDSYLKTSVLDKSSLNLVKIDSRLSWF